MSGIYIHIPFCRKACHYCNFHFSTQIQHLDAFVEALIKEIALQEKYLKQKLKSPKSLVESSNLRQQLNELTKKISLRLVS